MSRVPTSGRLNRLSRVDRFCAGFLCLALAVVACAEAAAQSSSPVPRPRPDAGAAASPEEPGPEPDATRIDEIPVQAKPEFDLAAAKECEAALRALGARFAVLDPVVGEGQCGWPRPLRLDRFSRAVATAGESMLRCEVALALARWSSEVVVPSAELHMGTGVSAIEVSTTYQCRRRNNNPTGKLSEHGFANGVDLLAVQLASGERIDFRDRRGEAAPDRAFQAAIRGGACAYFTTVLGPMTNADHAGHVHVDLAVRNGGYRICE